MNLNKVIKTIVVILLFSGAVVIAQETDQSENMHSIQIKTKAYTGQFSWHFQSAEATENSGASLVEHHRRSTGPINALHGTPGSWTAWEQLMVEPGIEQFDFIALDRPGWGSSNAVEDNVFPKLKDQAAIIAQAMRSMNLQQPVILVTHSWGGPVALEFASRFENLVDGMVLIASPADAEVSRPRWYHKAARLKLVQWIIGSQMSRSNIEMLSLDSELELLKPSLKDIEIPIVIMQGKKDWLVKPDNAFYLKQELTNSSTRLMYYEKLNHFIPFKQTDEVIKAIDWVVKKTIAIQPEN